MASIIEELRELEAKATPGPWEVIMPNPPELWDARIFAGTRFVGMVGNSDNADGCDEANARLIATMRNALTALLARLEALEDVAEAAGFALDDDGAKWVGILRERLDALEALP